MYLSDDHIESESYRSFTHIDPYYQSYLNIDHTDLCVLVLITLDPCCLNC